MQQNRLCAKLAGPQNSRVCYAIWKLLTACNYFIFRFKRIYYRTFLSIWINCNKKCYEQNLCNIKIWGVKAHPHYASFCRWQGCRQNQLPTQPVHICTGKLTALSADWVLLVNNMSTDEEYRVGMSPLKFSIGFLWSKSTLEQLHIRSVS